MGKTRSKSKEVKGPYLVSALFCEKILEEKDSVHTLVRVADVIQIQGIPELTPVADSQIQTELAITIMLYVSFKTGDAPGDYVIELTQISPSGIRRKVAEMPVTLLGSGENGINARAVIPVLAKEEGLHWYELRLSGKLATRIPLRIVHVQTAPVHDESSESASEPEGEE